MSDVEDFDDDLILDDDRMWMYVEEHYDTADELAEYTCPSPVMEPLNQEYDPYDYWQDLHYLSDAVYDEDKVSKERKRKYQKKSPAHPTTNGKRRRLENMPGFNEPIVVWRSSAEMLQLAENAPVLRPDEMPSVALFADWRQRFADVRGLEKDSSGAKTMPSIEGDALRSAAGMLSEEQMNQLRELVAAKGLDPNALDVVLEDLIAGEGPESEEHLDDDEDSKQLLKDDTEMERELKPSLSTINDSAEGTNRVPSKRKRLHSPDASAELSQHNKRNRKTTHSANEDSFLNGQRGPVVPSAVPQSTVTSAQKTSPTFTSSNRKEDMTPSEAITQSGTRNRRYAKHQTGSDVGLQQPYVEVRGGDDETARNVAPPKRRLPARASRTAAREGIAESSGSNTNGARSSSRQTRSSTGRRKE